MDILNGIARNVNKSVSVSHIRDMSEPQYRNRTTKITTHISEFEIDKQNIKAESSKPTKINEGDNIIIAGNIDNDIFELLAYKNLTTGVNGDKGWVQMVFVGVILLCFATANLIILLYFVDVLIGLFLFGIGIFVFTISGLVFLNTSIHIYRAVKELNKLS